MEEPCDSYETQLTETLKNKFPKEEHKQKTRDPRRRMVGRGKYKKKYKYKFFFIKSVYSKKIQKYYLKLFTSFKRYAERT